MMSKRQTEHGLTASAWRLLVPKMLRVICYALYYGFARHLPGAILGAGAVVARDVPDCASVGGSPAVVIGDRRGKDADAPCQPDRQDQAGGTRETT